MPDDQPRLPSPETVADPAAETAVSCLPEAGAPKGEVFAAEPPEAVSGIGEEIGAEDAPSEVAATVPEVEEETAPLPEADLVLSPVLRGKVNFAAAQNGVSILRGLSIANRGPDAVQDVAVHLSATPAVLRPKAG
ncbi:hypothetical protein QWZ10_24060 [Paracoccus cavernae]|uniref:Uncharacterized protein n=1 Tax=Paracoccus cavernae TaxID=1571207 RepID=A0ABT8DCC6_9RHOB|nr:hypothetical protein [Paracoccus cavernae]